MSVSYDRYYAVKDEKGDIRPETIRDNITDTKLAFTQLATFTYDSRSWDFWFDRGCKIVGLEIIELVKDFK